MQNQGNIFDFFVEKQKLVVHPHKNVQRVFFIYIGSFDTPSTEQMVRPLGWCNS